MSTITDFQAPISPGIPQEPSATAGFSGLGIAPKLLDALARLKFTVPTPIQAKAIPIAVEGNDVIGIAQTGTGKTLAFGIPMIQGLARKGGKGLIVLPTRELALQVEETLVRIGASAGLRTAVLIGGASMVRQKEMLRRNPHIIVGTPGRIIDHMEQRTLKLSEVTILVLDEADRMLDMGFMPQISRILSAVPKEPQTMLFSATMPDDIVRIASSHMKSPVRVEIARAGTAAERVAQEIFVVRKDQKNRLVDQMLAEVKGPVLVFSRTKFGAKRLTRAIRDMKHAAAEIHSDRSLAQRREALEGFKSGKYRVLVATDIAARGIDVTGIEMVINFDLPDNPDDYVHRIGRTGRAGRAGRAVSFATPDQGGEVKAIERLMRVMLPITPMPTLPPERPSSPGAREYIERPQQRSRPGSYSHRSTPMHRVTRPSYGVARPIPLSPTGRNSAGDAAMPSGRTAPMARPMAARPVAGVRPAVGGGARPAAGGARPSYPRRDAKPIKRGPRPGGYYFGSKNGV